MISDIQDKKMILKTTVATILYLAFSTTVVEGKCKFVNYDLEVFEKDIFIRMTDKQNDCQNNGYLNEETVFIVDVYEGPIEHLNGSQSSKSPNLTCTGVSCIEMMKIPREACVSDSGCIVDIQVSSREISPIPYFILDLTTFEVNSHVIKGNFSERGIINLTNWACGYGQLFTTQPNYLVYFIEQSGIVEIEISLRNFTVIESSDPQDNTTYIDITDSHNIYNPTSNVVIIEYCEERLVICINTEPMMFEGNGNLSTSVSKRVEKICFDSIPDRSDTTTQQESKPNENGKTLAISLSVIVLLLTIIVLLNALGFIGIRYDYFKKYV